MEFDYFWKKRRKENEGEPKYISLCYILEGSGEDRDVLTQIFDKYMTKNDFDVEERLEMIDYLFDIALDIHE